MNVEVDIGNTNLKCGIFCPKGRDEHKTLRLPTGRLRLGKNFLRELLHWTTMDVHSTPITWRIAPTGSFPWQELKAEILKIRPHDKFKIVARKNIPLKIDVDSPQKVGIDRLLAAFASVKTYGNAPMLIVDAGSAITVDVVQNQTFCGGAILPGLTALSETYPKISEKLPLVPLLPISESSYPGKNTKDAIQCGLHWGTIGAIRQFYEMFSSQKKDIRLVLTGGDADYLLPGLAHVIPSQRIEYNEFLVLEGIRQCFNEYEK